MPNPKENIKLVCQAANKIRSAICDLNRQSADLNGVAAVVPEDAPYPARTLAGCRVILSNVVYDTGNSHLTACIKVPYEDNAGKALPGGGQILRFNIDETWI